jgi:2-C-methyl-D-erythritol 2,4-cyclodiphosphate synthase
MYRIGIGYDIHQLTQGRDLIIGGVKITHEKGLLGHSDADVLIHAIIDAMLGALALSDIGTLFPDTEPKYKNADSAVLLRKVYDYVLEKGYAIGNIDGNIIAQQPKMMPYIPKMKEILCKVLNIKENQLSIKAKTNEQLDAVGEGRAIKAQVVVLLVNGRQQTESGK